MIYNVLAEFRILTSLFTPTNPTMAPPPGASTRFVDFFQVIFSTWGILFENFDEGNWMDISISSRSMQWVLVQVNDFRSKCSAGRRHYDTDDDWRVPSRDYRVGEFDSGDA